MGKARRPSHGCELHRAIQLTKGLPADEKYITRVYKSTSSFAPDWPCAASQIHCTLISIGSVKKPK